MDAMCPMYSETNATAFFHMKRQWEDDIVRERICATNKQHDIHAYYKAYEKNGMVESYATGIRGASTNGANTNSCVNGAAGTSTAADGWGTDANMCVPSTWGTRDLEPMMLVGQWIAQWSFLSDGRRKKIVHKKGKERLKEEEEEEGWGGGGGGGGRGDL